MPILEMSDPVGASVPSSGAAADATLVQQRLVDLGSDCIAVDGIAEPNTIRGIKLFQSIKNGKLDVEAIS